MRIIVTALVVVGFMTGCATTIQKPLDQKSSIEIKNQTVSYVNRKKPDFSAMTAGKAAFAILGAAAMVSEGNAIIANNEVPDPANAIALGLVKEMEKAYGTHLVTPPTTVESDDLPEVLAKANGTAKYIVDVQTMNWSFVYFPTDWAHYRVIYSAKARLVDVHTQTVVAEGTCKRIPETSAGAPTYDELLANHAAHLKGELEEAVIDCIRVLKTEMLSL